MTSPRTLLVAHDFSKRADRAIRRARMLSADKEPVVVFHAAADAGPLEAIRDRLSARLQTMLGPEELGRFTIETHSGTPEDVAAQLAQTHGADLLLLGLHGKAGLT